MVVPFVEFAPDITIDNASGNPYHGGCIGGWVEASTEPRRPIGFRPPEPEPEPLPSPAWMLL